MVATAALLVRLAAAHPVDGAVAATQGKLAARAGDHPLAAACYAAACLASPDDMVLRVRLSRSLRGAGRPADAVAVLRGVPSSEPQALAERAYALVSLRELAQARREIDDLARLHPGFAQLDRLAALHAEALGDLPAAAAASARALALDPANAGLLAQRRRWLRLGGDSAALAALADATPAARDDIRGDLVETLLDQNACEAAEAVLATWSDDGAGVMRLRGAVLLALRRGQHALAAAHAAAILAQHRDDAWALWRQAEALALAFRAEAAWGRLRRLEALGVMGRRTARNNAIGHLVNDMRLHPASMAMLAVAASQPAAEAMGLAAELVRREASATAPALALLRAWPGAGVPGVDPTPIPRCLHRVEEAEDAQAAFLAARLRALNPGLAVEGWTPASLLAQGEGALPPTLREALRLAPSDLIRADLLRLGVLTLHGGLWLEARLLCVSALHPLLPTGAGLVLAADLRGAVGTVMVAARPGHRVLRAALEEACDQVIGGARESAWLSTGGGLLTRQLARLLALEQGLAGDIVLHGSERIGQHLRPVRRVPWQRAMGSWTAEM